MATASSLFSRLASFTRRSLVAVGIVLLVLMITFWGGARGPVVPSAGAVSGFGPSQSGELVIGQAVRGVGAGKGTPDGWFELMVTLPSGRQLLGTLREYLPAGEHVWAGYSLSSTMDAVRLETYVRCGKKPCPLSVRR